MNHLFVGTIYGTLSIHWPWLAGGEAPHQGDDEGLEPPLRHHHHGCARAVVADLETGTPGALCSELSAVVNSIEMH